MRCTVYHDSYGFMKCSITLCFSLPQQLFYLTLLQLLQVYIGVKWEKKICNCSYIKVFFFYSRRKRRIFFFY